MRSFLRLFAAALACAAFPASATFHLWSMDELYTNADGSIQFLELTALAGGQQFVAGHTVSATQGGTLHTFTMATNLPSDSAGHRLLIGTQSFAALGIITPDFVVPDGFFFTGNATLDWGGGADVWKVGTVPTDGVRSLNRDGSTGTNSPQNFAGRTGTIGAAPPPPPPPAPSTGDNFEGLWWHSPAGSESGWGINITHQDDTIFATWFTYDTDGSGLWIVMADGTKVAPDTYSGTLYRTTGPAFDAATFDASKVVATPVGSGTFTFSDGDNGTFAYTVNGVTQSKPITREVFATPAPVCASGGTPSATNFQDLWWNAPAGSESGWGINITHQADTIFATWFTYDHDGKGLWLVLPNAARVGVATYGGDGVPPGPPKYSGTLYRTTGPAFSAVPWDPTRVTATAVGNATFVFDAPASGTFTYTVNGVTQSKSITREVFASKATVCQ